MVCLCVWVCVCVCVCVCTLSALNFIKLAFSLFFEPCRYIHIYLMYTLLNTYINCIVINIFIYFHLSS